MNENDFPKDEMAYVPPAETPKGPNPALDVLYADTPNLFKLVTGAEFIREFGATPENCPNCTHSKMERNSGGTGHCYMFKDPPRTPCHQYEK